MRTACSVETTRESHPARAAGVVRDRYAGDRTCAAVQAAAYVATQAAVEAKTVCVVFVGGLGERACGCCVCGAF